MTAVITLTTAGEDTGPFDLYSNLDGYTVPFAINVPKASLQTGYTSAVVPDYTVVVRVISKGMCINFVDIVLVADAHLFVLNTDVDCPTACGLAAHTELNLQF